MIYMINKQDLRETLEDSSFLNYILYNIKKRGFHGDSDTLTEIQSAVVESLLEHEEYYKTEFKYNLKTYTNLVITQVFDRVLRKPDALNGELVFLDAPTGEYDMTNHDVLSQDASLADSTRAYTKVGRPEELTYYMAQLTEQQADIFVLKTVYGFTHKEAAQMFGLSEAYSKELYREAKRELAQFISSERAYVAQQQIGDVSGRIITNNDSDVGVWNDWSWREEHNVPSPVVTYNEEEFLALINPNWCKGCSPDNCSGCKT